MTEKVINVKELLGQSMRVDYKPATRTSPGHLPTLEEPEDVEVDAGNPLTQVAASLKESFENSTWALKSGDSVPHDVYTAALRGVLVEWGGDPVNSLPARLKAADALAGALGMSEDEHEALLLRALNANERIVSELQSQANALKRHKLAVKQDDFVSPIKYDAWRQRALCGVRAVLLAQQSMPAYNALLEVSLVSADELVDPVKKGGFWCCAAPDDPMSPYAWASLMTGAGAGQVTASLGTRVQRTQVDSRAGARPVWRQVLQPISLTREDCELRFKVQNCLGDPSQPSAPRDTVLGVTGIRLPGLQGGLTLRLSMPLFCPPKSSQSPQAGDADTNTFYRVVWDPAQDSVPGADGLLQQGRLLVQVRYVVERRERAEVPREEEFVASDDEDYEDSRSSSQDRLGGIPRAGAARVGNNVRASPGAGRAWQSNPMNGGMQQVAVNLGGGGGQQAQDYLAYLGQAIGQGVGDNPLAFPEAVARFASRFRSVGIQPVAQPLNVRPHNAPKPLNPIMLVKQLAAVLNTANRAGKLTGPAAAAVSALSALPNIPIDLQPLLLSPSRRAARRANAPSAPGKKEWDERRPNAQGNNSSTDQGTGIEVVWKLVKNAMVQPYLPWGAGLGIILRVSTLLCVRAETVLLLVVQHMMELWPTFINTTITLRGTRPATAGGAVETGGAQDYLSALKAVWEPCVRWHAAGNLTNDETEGVKGIMGLLLSRALPALEKHYTVFAGQEGAACFQLVLELVGWAWTWDPEQPTPLNLLTDYLKESATQRMDHNFRPSAQTIAQDVEALAKEVKCATEDYHRDKAIQLQLSGLKGFAQVNAAARYDLLTDHLDAVMLYKPGTSKAAMQAMFKLEEALLEHHALLVAEGCAEALRPPQVPENLKPHRSLPGSREPSMSGSEVSQLDQAMSELGDGENRTSATRRSGGNLMHTAGKRIVAQADGGYLEIPTINLWDWENAFIEELGRWVKTGADEMHTSMMRLVKNETWTPVTKQAGVAASALEFSRLIEANTTTWVDAACAGSDARRLVVGALVTACLMHVMALYVEATTTAWDQELDERAAIFGGAPRDSKAKDRALDADGGAVEDAPWFRRVFGGAKEPSGAGAAPRASKQAVVRVMSLAVGMKDTSGPGQHKLVEQLGGGQLPLDLAAQFVNAPAAGGAPKPGHGHKRSRSRATLPGAAGATGSTWQDVPALRQQLADALEQHPGLALTPKMCVIRCTLHKISQEARDLGAVLLQCFIAPSFDSKAAKGFANGRGSLALGTLARTSGAGTWGSSLEELPESEEEQSGTADDGNPWARKKNTMQGQKGAGDADDNPWGRKRGVAPAGLAHDNGHHLGRLPPRNPRRSTDEGKKEEEATPIANFVGHYWQELHRRSAAAIASMVSGYSMQVRSILISMMVAACGIKDGDPPEPDLLQGLMRSLDDELQHMKAHLCGEVVLLAEACGAVWRSAMSALQLMALHQAGFRPLSEAECELLRELLISMQQHFKEEVPSLLPKAGPNKATTIDMKQLPDPQYPQRLAAQQSNALPAFAHRQYTLKKAATPTLTSELLASVTMRVPPVMPDATSARVSSADYCSALLQLAAADTQALEDLYKAQESSLHLLPTGDGQLFVQLGAQQLSLLDLLRLLRARRKAEPGAAAWADARIKEGAALITQILGLVSKERVVAESRCLLAGASRSQGRLIVTQNTLNFTTLLDDDAKKMTDTTLSILRAKIVSVSAGQEQGSLVLTTSDYEVLAFSTFATPSERDRLIQLLKTPAPVHAPPKPPAPAPVPAPAPMKAHANAVRDPVSIASRIPAAEQQAAPLNARGPSPLRKFGPIERDLPAPVPAFVGGGGGGGGGRWPDLGDTSITSGGGGIPSGSNASSTDDLSKPSRVSAMSFEERMEQRRRQREAEEAAKGLGFGTSMRVTPPEPSPNVNSASANRLQRPSAPGGINKSPPAAAAAADKPGVKQVKANAPAATVPAPAAAQPPPLKSTQVVMSVPCALTHTISSTQGLLVLYTDRLEFENTEGVCMHSVDMASIDGVSTQSSTLRGTLLEVKAGGPQQLLFAGLSDALVASMKQSILDLLN